MVTMEKNDLLTIERLSGYRRTHIIVIPIFFVCPLSLFQYQSLSYHSSYAIGQDLTCPVYTLHSQFLKLSSVFIIASWSPAEIIRH